MATRFAFWRKIEEDSLAEKHAQPGLLSDFILGSQDGLVNVLGVILGVAIASYRYPNPIAIILAGGRPRAVAGPLPAGPGPGPAHGGRRGRRAAEGERAAPQDPDPPGSAPHGGGGIRRR